MSSGIAPLTDAETQNISRLIADIEREIAPLDGDDERKVTMLAKMLITLAGGVTDAMTVRAKQEAYAVGLADIPAWAVEQALHQWYSGQVKALKVSSSEYQWPPAPGIFAIICRSLLQPYKDAVDQMKSVLDAKPLDETLKLLHQRRAA